MVERNQKIAEIMRAIARSRVVHITGPRQSGKTTLARQFAAPDSANYFDCENPQDLVRLEDPILSLGMLRGLVVIDEVQRKPELFPVLRVLADRADGPATFLILGSTSGKLSGQASESLAGRIETIEIDGFRLGEIDAEESNNLWMRGSFPLSFLARTDEDSAAWRRNFVRTFLERDIAALGIRIPVVAMYRFWSMLAHYHGQTWKATAPAQALNDTERNVRKYLDILTETYMVRQLQPYFANSSKRQLKMPKVYLRDSGILHQFFGVQTLSDILQHPRIGASWEGFAIENILTAVEHDAAWYWGTHAGAEIDLLLQTRGKLYGYEIKWTQSPRLTRSMITALTELELEHIVVVYPGTTQFSLHDKVHVVPLVEFCRNPI